jgi:hypothetical protein
MNWPIREALKGRLKNTTKRKVQRQTDQKIQKVRGVDVWTYAASLTDL